MAQEEAPMAHEEQTIQQTDRQIVEGPSPMTLEQNVHVPKNIPQLEPVAGTADEASTMEEVSIDQHVTGSEAADNPSLKQVLEGSGQNSSQPFSAAPMHDDDDGGGAAGDGGDGGPSSSSSSPSASSGVVLDLNPDLNPVAFGGWTRLPLSLQLFFHFRALRLECLSAFEPSPLSPSASRGDRPLADSVADSEDFPAFFSSGESDS